MFFTGSYKLSWPDYSLKYVSIHGSIWNFSPQEYLKYLEVYETLKLA